MLFRWPILGRKKIAAGTIFFLFILYSIIVLTCELHIHKNAGAKASSSPLHSLRKHFYDIFDSWLLVVCGGHLATEVDHGQNERTSVNFIRFVQYVRGAGIGKYVWIIELYTKKKIGEDGKVY